MVFKMRNRNYDSTVEIPKALRMMIPGKMKVHMSAIGRYRYGDDKYKKRT